MIVLTLQDVHAHRREVPWAELYQVEQDLLLCLAMRAIFSDRFLAKEVAMRGGTVLHKVHLAPAARYSEDIDLVAVGEMRAMFQRKKGRDLFDLYWALTAHTAKPVDLERVLVAFDHYMGAEGTSVPRAEFIAHLEEYLADRTGFCTDMTDLLRVGVAYDPLKAGAYLKNELLVRLPG